MPLPDEQQQIEAIGEQLRAKLASKFTASTFLAGFALAVLTGQIFALWQAEHLPRLFPPSVGTVFGALLLFIGGVVRLDELTMPKRFWPENPKAQNPPELGRGYLIDQDLWELQKRMVFFWQRLTLAATGIIGLAVLAMLLPLPSIAAVTARRWTFWWTVAGFAIAVGYYRWLRAKEVKTFNPLVRPVD